MLTVNLTELWQLSRDALEGFLLHVIWRSELGDEALLWLYFACEQRHVANLPFVSLPFVLDHELSDTLASSVSLFQNVSFQEANNKHVFSTPHLASFDETIEFGNHHRDLCQRDFEERWSQRTIPQCIWCVFDHGILCNFHRFSFAHIMLQLTRPAERRPVQSGTGETENPKKD